MIDGRSFVIRRTHRLRTIKRVVGERNRCATLVIDRNNLKCRPAAIDHRKTRALAHPLDDVGKRCPQAFRRCVVPCVDMRLTCTHAYHMSKMVQIRNVPEALHRKLKVRAAEAGQTLSDYLLAELERLAARPTRDEMLTRLHGRKRVTLKTPAAVVVREERESV